MTSTTGLPHPGLQSPWIYYNPAFQLGRFWDYFIFTDFLGILGSDTWTAKLDRIFRLDSRSNLRYGLVRSFQRGSFRRYI